MMSDMVDNTDLYSRECTTVFHDLFIDPTLWCTSVEYIALSFQAWRAGLFYADHLFARIDIQVWVVVDPAVHFASAHYAAFKLDWKGGIEK